MSNETLHMIFDTSDETFEVATSNEKLLLREERTKKIHEDTQKAMLILSITERLTHEPFDGPSFFKFTMDPLMEQLFWGVYDSKPESEKTKPTSVGARELLEEAMKDDEEMQEIVKLCMSVLKRMMSSFIHQSTGECNPELSFDQRKVFAEIALMSALMEIWCIGMRYGPALEDLKALNSIPMEGGV